MAEQGNIVEDFFHRMSDLAEELGLEDDERDTFIEQSMLKKGFRKLTTWGEPEPAENEKGPKVSSLFGGGAAPQTRNVGNPKQQRQSYGY